MAEEQEIDPIGLIADAYRIEGIGAAECRSVFLDWALKLPAGQDPAAAIAALLERHAATAPDHPMTAVLRAGLAPAEAPRRRGRLRARLRGSG